MEEGETNSHNPPHMAKKQFGGNVVKVLKQMHTVHSTVAATVQASSHF